MKKMIISFVVALSMTHSGFLELHGSIETFTGIVAYMILTWIFLTWLDEREEKQHERKK